MPERVEILSYDPFEIDYDEGQVASKILLMLPEIWISLPKCGVVDFLNCITHYERGVGFPLQPAITLTFEEPVSIGEWARALVQSNGIKQNLQKLAKEYVAIASEKMEGFGDSTLERLNLIGMLNSLRKGD